MLDISPTFSVILYIISSLIYDTSNSFILKILLDNKDNTNYFLIVIYSIILFVSFINIIFHIYFFIVRTQTALQTLDNFLFKKMIFSLLCSFFNFSSKNIKSYFLFIIANYALIILMSVSYSRGYDKLRDLSEGLPFFIGIGTDRNQRFSSPSENRLNENISKKVIPIEVLININYKSYIYNCESHYIEEESPSLSDCENCRCAICLENMNNKEVYKMNCNHIFDKKCFLDYISNCENKKITCPNCRSYII
jgi:phosphoglycerol transferase MdoB-like AlkP superfamily enzyme